MLYYTILYCNVECNLSLEDKCRGVRSGEKEAGQRRRGQPAEEITHVWPPAGGIRIGRKYPIGKSSLNYKEYGFISRNYL